jgi:methanogenic corrinoid protein MtbC1
VPHFIATQITGGLKKRGAAWPRIMLGGDEMTIAFDAPDGIDGQNSGQNRRQEWDTGASGGGLEWARISGRNSRLQREFPDNSGSLLTKVIEGEIIPRLLLAHRNLNALPKESAERLLSCEAFARLVLVSEVDEIVADLESLLNSGVALESVFCELLAPVARKLGKFWQQDVCSFTDVTLALLRLHGVLHRIGRRQAGNPFRAIGRRAFFAPVPGEHHTFGVSVMEEFFHHAGWETSCDLTPTAAGIVHKAATESLDIIGFCVGCQESLDPLSDLIEKTRDVSRNRDLAIMVGGGLFVDNQDLAARFGNATIVADGVNAVRIAEETMSRLPHCGRARKIA